MAANAVGLAVLGIEHGFEGPDFAVVAEQDILGDRMVRSHKRARRAQNFLSEASGLAPGDLVTHIEHGVGRYVGLQTIDVTGAPHDCLELQYDGGKLFLPVENIELLTRYGAEEGAAAARPAGRRGLAAAQGQSAKQRVREIAAELIRIAAARELKSAAAQSSRRKDSMTNSARAFPIRKPRIRKKPSPMPWRIFAKGRPMDRLVCGDVGFGKTEVALRTAFVVAMSGEQVAVVVPTTLLARQHYRTFAERFNGLPREGAPAFAFRGRQGGARNQGRRLATGDVDIVIGTHALLAKGIDVQQSGPGDRRRGAAFRRGA